MRSWLCAVVVAAVLGTASRADAMCAPPLWVGTPDGAHIPTRGSLYVYAGEWSNGHHVQIALSWIGAPGFAELNEIEPDVFKVTYSGASGSELVINARRFKLGDTWRAPSNAPSALAMTHVEYEGCGDPDVLQVQLDQPTAAVRIRWTFGERTREWVMPAWDDLLDIGQIGCGKTTVPTDELEVGGQLELVAIRFDGSEVRVRGIPKRVAASNRKVTEPDAFEIPDVVQLKREPSPREFPTPTRQIAIAIALLIAGLAVAGLWLRSALARR